MLRAAGLQPGDHIALCVENSPAFFAIAWGAHYAGLIYTPCSTSLTAEELSYIVTDCGASVFFLSHRFADRAAEDRRRRRPGVELRIAVGGAIDGYEDYEALVAAHEPTEPLDEHDAPRRAATCSTRRARPAARRASATSLTETDATLEDDAGDRRPRS